MSSMTDKTVTAERASEYLDQIAEQVAHRGTSTKEIAGLRRFIDQHSQPAVTLDEAVERALSATVCDGEDVRFYLRASCIVPDSNGEVDEVCTNIMVREVVRTILTAAGLPALVAECERLRAEVARQNDLLQWVERCANHHARTLSAKEALPLIQYHPSITAITESYADGVLPDGPNPYELAEQAEARATSEREACAERVRLALDMQSAPGHWIGLAVRAAMDTEPTIAKGGGTI